ncbi:E2 protein [Human papillomavirus 95]|uniref:Regulatory protein E2 n=1 Tax=Human papillomavirus 95 TaxID=260716 RepID=Q705D6_9PAPI|nr:E2 protein [Human papillomavirus 95]
MESLVARFDALQEEILTHIESGNTTLESQIKYWENVRKENAIMHYARKQGLTKLGLQPLPSLLASEYNAKQAIQIQLTLLSLLKSPYASEPWTLPEVSAELINTPPQNVLKKGGYDVTVWFDDDRNNTMVYTNWTALYYQDANEIWHKVKGEVDYNGLFFTDHTGERAYFTLFSTDAERYSQTGLWTVHFKTQVISSSVVSSTNPSSFDFEEQLPGPSTSNTKTTKQTSPRGRGSQSRELQPSSTTSPEGKGLRVRRRRGQGESGSGTRETPSKRRRGGGGRGEKEFGSAPTPSEVGSRHRQVETKGLSRLGQLQADARDPPMIMLKGHANSLKCWRYRKLTSNSCGFLYMSTVWNWVGDSSENHSRMLIAFTSTDQRDYFVKHHFFPRQCTYTFGSLNSL